MLWKLSHSPTFDSIASRKPTPYSTPIRIVSLCYYAQCNSRIMKYRADEKEERRVKCKFERNQLGVVFTTHHFWYKFFLLPSSSFVGTYADHEAFSTSVCVWRLETWGPFSRPPFKKYLTHAGTLCQKWPYLLPLIFILIVLVPVTYWSQQSFTITAGEEH